MTRKKKTILALAVLSMGVAGIGVLFFSSIDVYEKRLQNNFRAENTDLAQFRKSIVALRLADPAVNPAEKDLADLGRMLFFDTRLSANGAVACVSCHKLELSFTDGLINAIGIAQTDRNTPTIINSFASLWFFWDGRADSLAAQALGPLENAKEHGLSRSEVVYKVLTNYREAYEKIFGKVSPDFIAAANFKLPPSIISPLPSAEVLEIAISSVTNVKTIAEIASKSGQIDDRAIEAFKKMSGLVGPVNRDPSVHLDPLILAEINRHFRNIGLAFEAYEKGLVANQSPFDRFAKSWTDAKNDEVKKFYQEDFGGKELLGLQIFLGKGQCQTCHTGGNFSDSQFHNIGLPQLGDRVELGRTIGLMAVTLDEFNCLGAFADRVERQRAESCLDLPYLNKDTPEAIGAFKTPTLRNVSQTAPYMHDGRFVTLRQVLEHYNNMNTLSGVGFREETLKPLALDDIEFDALEAFLKSLLSPIRDLSTGERPLH